MKSSRLTLLLCVVGLCVGVFIWWTARPDPKPIEGNVPSEHGVFAQSAVPAVADTVSNVSAPPAILTGREVPRAAETAAVSVLRALAENNRFERRHALERLGYEAGIRSVASATEVLDGITAPAERAAFLRGLFSKLAEGSSSAALNALQSFKNESDRAAALDALVASWETEPSTDQRKDLLALQAEHPDVRQLARLLGNPALAAEAAMTLLSGGERAQLLRMAAVATVEQDPQRALQYAQFLTGSDQNDLLEAVGRAWGRREGEAALAWANSQADPALRAQLQANVLAGWSFNEPEKAAGRIAEIPDTETRQKVLQFIASSWASSDTQAALNWARAQPDAATRQHALSAIQSSAPVGIGVSLASSPEGLPVIQGLIPNSPASAGGVLQPGYQIASVADGRGGFTDLRGMNIGDVAKLLRGKPGSSVVLQVIPEGAAPNQRRLVSITRQQLIFKAPQGTP